MGIIISESKVLPVSERYPKHLFMGADLPDRKIAQFLLVTSDISKALVVAGNYLQRKGVKILSGNISTQPKMPVGYLSFFVDLTDANVDVEILEKDIKKLDIVKEARFNTASADGLLMDTLEFPLVVMNRRSITLRSDTFAMFTQGFYGEFKDKAKSLLFRLGMNSGKEKCDAVRKMHGLKGKDAINAIMAERVAKGWGIPTIKKFDPSGLVEIETEDLFECSPFKGKMQESTSHFFRGYLSGVVSKALGKELIAREERCIAKGDGTCYFVVEPEEKGDFAPPEPIPETPKIKNDLFANFSEIFGRDIRFLVLKFLSSKEVASIREISRKVGMSPKNLSKYLDHLTDKGVIEVVYRGKNIRLYRIAQKGEVIKRFIRNKL